MEYKFAIHTYARVFKPKNLKIDPPTTIEQHKEGRKCSHVVTNK